MTSWPTERIVRRVSILIDSWAPPLKRGPSGALVDKVLRAIQTALVPTAVAP